MIVISVAAFWLQQAALQTGALSAAVASSMAFDPLSSIPLGIVIFDEQLHETALGMTASVLALAVTLLGLVVLARAKGSDPPRFICAIGGRPCRRRAPDREGRRGGAAQVASTARRWQGRARSRERSSRRAGARPHLLGSRQR
jgi:H+/Cl- antiporter ClcA